MKISRGGLAALGLVCIMGASGIAHSTTQSQTQVAPWQQETYATQTIVAWEQQATATAQALTATAITPTPTQGGRIIPPPAGSGPNDRYYASGTPVATMISDASSLAQQQVKVLIEQQVKEYWSVIQSTFGFSTLEKAIDLTASE